MTEADAPRFQRQDVRAEGGFAYGVVGADLHVFGDGTPVYLLFARRGAPAADAEWLRAQPSRMLDARAEVVDFTGRDAELGELTAWREGPARFAVRWLHGPGGQGKTRLAARLAADSEAAGWKVVDAVHGTDTAPPAEGSQDLALDGHRGVLVLVDYADRWPASHLSWLFHNSLLRQGVPARILLIARSAHGWPAVRGQLNRLRENIDTSDQELRPLPADGSERDRMFRTARACFAAHYPEADAADSIPPPGPLGHPDFGLTLAVQMAALVAVDARAHGRRPPEGMVGLTAYLLDREHENWRQLYENADAGLPHRTPDHVMARAVFTAVLTGPVSVATGRGLLGGLLPEAEPDVLLGDHAACYPPADPARTQVLQPLLPDRLAEDFLALSLPGSPVTGYATDSWATLGVTALLARGGDGAAAPWTPRAVTFLAEAADRWPHVGHGHLFPVLRQDPELALDAGSAALASLAGIGELDFGMVEGIERRFRSVTGNTRHVDIDVGYAVLTERVVERLLTEGADDRELAGALHTLAVRLAHAGRRGEALEAESQALECSRAVVEAGNPDRQGRGVDLHNHAMALNHLSDLLATAGDLQDAAETAMAVVEIMRNLARDDEERYMAPFAHATGTLASRLKQLGHTAKALEYAEIALVMYDEVVRSDPARKTARHLSGYTAAARQLASLLDENDRPQDALKVYGAALEYGRVLADAAGESELPGLAAALSGVGLTLARLGRHEEALEPTTEAAELFRRLEKTNPAEFRSNLAGALQNLGEQLAALSRRREALAAFEEALALFRRLAEADPDAHLPKVAELLGRVADMLSATGRRTEAPAADEESVAILRRLARDEPPYREILAPALNNLGLRLAEAGRLADAVAPAREALALHRDLAQEDPGTYLPLLAVAAYNMGVRYGTVGRPAEAVEALVEAVGRFRQLAAMEPADRTGQLALALGSLGEELGALGRHDEMLAVSQESLDLLRPRSTSDGDRLLEFTKAQLTYALMRQKAGVDLDAALAEAVDAVNTYWPAAERNPVFIPALKQALGILVDVCEALGMHSDAADFRRKREGIPEPDRPCV